MKNNNKGKRFRVNSNGRNLLKTPLVLNFLTWTVPLLVNVSLGLLTEYLYYNLMS